MKNLNKPGLFMVPVLKWGTVTFTDYKSNIGYTDLQNLLGSSYNLIEVDWTDRGQNT